MREGMLHIRDVEGPKKTGSVETRLEAMEQQVFKCQGMVERGLNANHMMITEFTNKHRIDANAIGKHLSRLYDRVDQLQGQIYDLQNQNWKNLLNRLSLMDKIVNIRYVDKEAFMNVDIVEKYEEVLTFLDSPTYEEVVAETQIRLKWVDRSDQVELLGRYDVGSAHKCRMKTMPIKSNLHWVAYKGAVASSIHKSLEVFASRMVNAPLHVDLNQPLVDDMSPYNGVAPIVEHKVEVQVNEYPQYEFRGSALIKDDGHDSDEEYERQHNIVGDAEAQVWHDDMDPDIVYQGACADESDDEGPVNELDEDGFTEKEAEWNDMDDLMSTREFGSGHFMEPRDRNQCGDCNEMTHNKRTCKRDNASTSDVGGRGGSSAGGGRYGGSSGGLAMGRGSGDGRRGGSSGGLATGVRLDQYHDFDVFGNVGILHRNVSR
ncbi:40S ribosomal protein S5-1 [Hordeum vulgare]|nr:40S ribosomal protein S5-1 [Hordeum vulgare]